MVPVVGIRLPKRPRLGLVLDAPNRQDIAGPAFPDYTVILQVQAARGVCSGASTASQVTVGAGETPKLQEGQSDVSKAGR